MRRLKIKNVELYSHLFFVLFFFSWVYLNKYALLR